ADAQTTPAEIQVVTSSPNGTVDPAQLPLTAAQQLDQAQRTMDAYRLKYKPDHPEYKRLERLIAGLKERVAEEAKNPTPPAEKAQSPIEQARLKRIRDLQAELEVIDHQLAGSQTEQARLQHLIADYQLKVDALPKRESELVELTRDYDILKKTYDSLLTKR